MLFMTARGAGSFIDAAAEDTETIYSAELVRVGSN